MQSLLERKKKRYKGGQRELIMASESWHPKFELLVLSTDNFNPITYPYTRTKMNTSCISFGGIFKSKMMRVWT